MTTVTFPGSGNLTSPWNVLAGSFNQTGGAVYGNSPGASSYAVYTSDASCNDQEASVIFSPATNPGQYIGPAIRCSNSAFTCANVDASTTDTYVSTWSAGTQTVVAGPLTAATPGDTITLRAVGTTLTLYYNGVSQGSWTPAGLPASGYRGLTAYSSGSFVGTTQCDFTNLDAADGLRGAQCL